VTRCFGKYLEYVTFVPFVELMNHECSDVYYDFKYGPANLRQNKQEDFPPAREISPAEEENQSSSDGSYNSENEDEAADFLLYECEALQTPA